MSGLDSEQGQENLFPLVDRTMDAIDLQSLAVRVAGGCVEVDYHGFVAAPTLYSDARRFDSVGT